MDRGIFLAAHSASALMEKQAIIANNLANISTPGFKKQFQMQATFVADAQSKLATRGYGVVTTPGVDLSDGELMSTSNPLNIALPKGHFLSVQGPDGVVYTKRGDMQINDTGQLVLSTGQLVLNVDGEPVEFPVGFKPVIGNDGSLSAQDPANPLNVVALGNLGIFFHENEGVKLRLDGFLSLKDIQVAQNPKVSVGFLEASNVSAAQVMVEMVETARLYDVGLKLVSTFEQVDRRGSELLGLYR